MPGQRPIRIAVQVQPQHADYAQLRDMVLTSEELGVDIVYDWDHFYPLMGDPDGKHFECWTMLGSMAEMTTSVEIGALVTCNSYRNPDLLGDMARTVDHISGGRLILGVGAGWFQKDYDQFGYAFGTVADRLRALDRDLPRTIERMAKGNPPPTRRIPVLVGGGGEKVTLRITAQHADIWHGFGDAEALRHKNAVLDEHCLRIGRDPAEIERSAGVNPGRIASGERLLAAGITQFTLGVDGTTWDPDAIRRWVAWRDERNAERAGTAQASAGHP
jgi:probable F420-dependent oxidoreductase